MSRRANLVRLTAPDERWVRRGALLLEDALRTASISGAGPGRLLLVRHLDVGTIHAGRSATALSVAIEERLRLLRASAVHAASAGAVQAQAVYFRDEIEAYTLLARRIARHQPANAWYWRLVAPDLDRRAPLRALVWHVLQTALGPAALVHVLANLAEDKTLDPVLGELAETDGPALLAALRWTPSLTTADDPAHRAGWDTPVQFTGEPAHLSPAWRAALRTWVPRWGRNDPRAQWLAGIALAAALPARMMDPALPRRAAGLVAYMAQHDPAQTGQDGGRDGPLQPMTDTLTGETVPPPLEANRRNVPPADYAPGSSPDAQQVHGTTESTPRPPAPGEPVPPHHQPETTDQPAATQGKPTLSLAGVPSWMLPPVTVQGGLFFLVHLLERLGFNEFLTAHPQWIEAELGWTILREAAYMRVLPEDDPLHALLVEHAPLEAGLSAGATLDFAYVCPAQWVQASPHQPEIAALNAVSLHRVTDQPGRRVLLDESGDLPLAVWTDKAPPAVRQMLAGSRLSVGPPLPEVPALARAWLTAAARWLEQNRVQCDLRDLIERHARLNVTRTHIDVIFGHDQADPQVRRWGLDFNPGWVPWLGRVVYFHYVRGI